MRWKKWLRWAGIAVLICVAGLAALMQVQQHILRWRAEHLLNDIREIQMGKSTWADAQLLMHKWGAWGDWRGTCTANDCKYQIAIQNGFSTHVVIYVEGDGRQPPSQPCCEWLNDAFRMLGKRQELIIATLMVRDGIIWGESFGMMIEVEPRDGADGTYSLEAHAESISHLPEFMDRELLHPEYEVGTPGACESCKHIYARFTPYADPAVVRNFLSDVNLECLTRRKPCLDESDVMPSTWKRVVNERGGGDGREAIASCGFPLELNSRDNRYVAIAELLSKRLKPGYGEEPEWQATFRLNRWLKVSSDVRLQNPIESRVRPELVYGTAGDRMELLAPGSSFILILDGPIDGENGLTSYLTDCGIVPLNDSNLAAIKRGIQRDVLPEVRMSWPAPY